MPDWVTTSFPAKIKRKVMFIMWNYTTDSGRLADAVGDEALSLAIKYNSIMSLSSPDCGTSKDLKNSIAFLELCKSNICNTLDQKIEEMKGRIKDVE